jgi:hypothetical protein
VLTSLTSISISRLMGPSECCVMWHSFFEFFTVFHALTQQIWFFASFQCINDVLMAFLILFSFYLFRTVMMQ